MLSFIHNLLGSVWLHLHSLAVKEARRKWYEANQTQLIETYGNPSRLNPVRKELAGLNEVYWAALWKLENTALYDLIDETFYRYSRESGLWKIISEDALKQEISSRILEISRTYPRFRGLGEFRCNAHLNAIVSQLRGLLEQPNPFETRPRVVHLANCCLTIENSTRKLHGYSPKFFSRNQSPIPYCPGAKCPRFLNELILPAVHPDDVGLIQRYMGQCLLGTNPTARMLILDGEGGTGKSQLAKVIRGIVGKENTYELRTKHVDGRFEMYRYINKTLLMGVDVKPDFLSTQGASELKKLTGGDSLNPEKKSGNGTFDLEGDLGCVITSNSRLKLRLEGDDSAWRRRLLIVRYKGVKPAQKVDKFANYLLATEGPGILNWALEGLEKLLAEIAVDNDFVLTSRQQQIINDLLDESQSLRIFVQEYVRPAAGSSITTAEVAEAYSCYCRSRGWGHGLKTSQIIGKDLADLMLEVHGRNDSHDLGPNRSQRGYRGFEIVAPCIATGSAQAELPASDASDAISPLPAPTDSSPSIRTPPWASEVPDDSEIPF